ncbi:MAG: purine-nucleoside phosphorylase [Candidatus Bipolaricaulota bacterium]|nr:purine-nucleoside phosphorylase [Candidatus Bipolaricaulota bacterium]
MKDDGGLEGLEAAASVLRKRLPGTPAVTIVLGSGLSAAVGGLGPGDRIPWTEIPGLPRPTVAGHAGEFWVGEIDGKVVLLQRGRVHYYEGYSLEEIVFPIRLFALVGVKVLILTNASGAINPDFSAGDLVLLRDHINMLGENPLRGKNLGRIGPRFPDMSAAYSPRLRKVALAAAEKEGIGLRGGVYLATLGPSYETPAEIRAFRTLGADLVGMSTVPEVIAARHAGMEVLGISCATNLAAGVNPNARLSHEEVIATTQRVGKKMRRLLVGIIGRL